MNKLMYLVSNSNYVSTSELYGDYLAHHGIRGQKWGVRRFQNEDGSLTASGRKHYYGRADKLQKDIDSFKGHEKGIRSKDGKVLLTSNDVRKITSDLSSRRDRAKARGDARLARDTKRYEKKASLTPEQKKARAKKIAKIGAVAAGTALVAYGGYKLYQAEKSKEIQLARDVASQYWNDRYADALLFRDQLRRY